MVRLLSDLGVNTFKNFAVGKAKQFVACNARRVRDRRRDSLLPRREPRPPRRAAVGAQLGAVPRRDRRLRRARSSATSARPSTRRAAASSTASRCRARTALDVLTKANGGSLPEIKFFNLGELTIAGHRVRALHHGMSGAPGMELFGPWDGGRGRARRARRGRRRLRPPAGRLAGLRHQHARVGLDPVPAAGRLHRRRAEGVPRVAAGERLRGDRLARRQLLLRRHRGLLPHAVGSRLRAVRQVRPRLHRPRRARGARRRRRSGARSRWPGTARTSRVRWARCSRRATRPSTSTCRCRTTRRGRTTRCCSTATT